MNKKWILGRLGSDAELKYAPNGTPVMELSIASSRKKGETWVTSWFRVSVWGQRAEEYAPFCKKGVEVFAYGEDENREWTGRDGQKKTQASLNADVFRVCVRTRQQEEGPSYQ